jgi:hypothetical protein
MIIIKKFSYVVFGAVILLFFAFYNKFPLVFPDTGTYIYSGFEYFIPIDRPIFYGLFIRHTSLNETLWLTILIQSIITSYLIYLVFQLNAFNVEHRNTSYLVFIVCATFFSSLSYFVSYLIPDIFTSITFISLILLINQEQLSTKNKILVYMIYFITFSFHSSNYIIFPLILIVYTTLIVLRKKKVILKNLYYIIIVTILSISSISVFNYLVGGNFKISNGGHVFIISRLSDWGILQDYLNKNCDTKNYAICKYKDEIPWDMIWDEKSPLYKTGGWDKNKDEYSKIIFDVFTDFNYVKKVSIRSLEATFRLFFNFEMEELSVQSYNSSPYNAINRYFNFYSKEYLESKQNTNLLKIDNFNIFSFLFLIFVVVFYIKNFNINKSNNINELILLILIFLLINAFVCGTFSGTMARYQSRVHWLIFLPFFLTKFLNFKQYYNE